MSHKTDITVHQREVIERILSMELVRVTERAAVSAARLRGHGDEKAADQAAVDAMRRELNRLPIDGRIVIGEGERDEAPMLYIGEKVGNGSGPKVDIAVDPLEGTTLCAKDMPGAIAVMAMAQAGSLLYAPDVYMDKIAIGPGYPQGIVDLDASPADNINALAKAKGVRPQDIAALIMDRPRHAKLIEEAGELAAGIAKKRNDKVMDGIGDMVVVLTILAAQHQWRGVDIAKLRAFAAFERDLPQQGPVAGVQRCQFTRWRAHIHGVGVDERAARLVGGDQETEGLVLVLLEVLEEHVDVRELEVVA